MLRELMERLFGHKHRFRLDRVLDVRDIDEDHGTAFEMPMATYTTQWKCRCGETMVTTERSFF